MWDARAPAAGVFLLERGVRALLADPVVGPLGALELAPLLAGVPGSAHAMSSTAGNRGGGDTGGGGGGDGGGDGGERLSPAAQRTRSARGHPCGCKMADWAELAQSGCGWVCV